MLNLVSANMFSFIACKNAFGNFTGVAASCKTKKQKYIKIIVSSSEHYLIL